MTGENLDIASGDEPRNSRTASREKRRFLGIQFACCDIYTRIYVNHDKTAYEGHCPRCAKAVQIRIGEGGGDCRFFTAY